MSVVSPLPRVALVAGASGIVGAGLTRRLLADGWRVICASRSGNGAPPGASGLALDLMQAEDCQRALATHADITHVFFAAYQQAANRHEEVAPNLAMLRNLVQAASQQAPGLRKVVLVTGAKFYGIQWGTSRTPCRESDPRHLPPNFYYDQEDYLREAQRGQRWSWVNLIPPFVSGYAVGNPMNLVLGVGLYAVLSRELGLPLRFPGTPGAWNALHQIADASQLGAAASWAADHPAACNEAFNVTNGDPTRWGRTWPQVAAHFGMATAETKTMPLADVMPGLSATWARLSQRHGLRPLDLGRVVNWAWADYMLRMEHDVILETGKIRRAGFAECVDTGDVFVQRLAELQANKILPP